MPFAQQQNFLVTQKQIRIRARKLTERKVKQALQSEFGRNKRIWNLQQSELFVPLGPPEP
jgi:hypothetical protein